MSCRNMFQVSPGISSTVIHTALHYPCNSCKQPFNTVVEFQRPEVNFLFICSIKCCGCTDVIKQSVVRTPFEEGNSLVKCIRIPFQFYFTIEIKLPSSHLQNAEVRARPANDIYYHPAKQPKTNKLLVLTLNSLT